jgi:hypothetical protein
MATILMPIDTGAIETPHEAYEMFDVYSTDWPVAVDSTDPRNQFHERAIHEARAASDYRQLAPAPRTRSALLMRLRHAFAGGPATTTTEPGACPA